MYIITRRYSLHICSVELRNKSVLVSICIPPLRNVKGLYYSTEGTNQYNFVGFTDFDGSLVELRLGGTIRGLHNNASASKRFFKL